MTMSKDQKTPVTWRIDFCNLGGYRKVNSIICHFIGHGTPNSFFSLSYDHLKLTHQYSPPILSANFHLSTVDRTTIHVGHPRFKSEDG